MVKLIKLFLILRAVPLRLIGSKTLTDMMVTMNK